MMDKKATQKLIKRSCLVKFEFYSILFYPLTLEGRRGTTDEFSTIPFHLVLFSAVLIELAKSMNCCPLKFRSHHKKEIIRAYIVRLVPSDLGFP